MLSRSHIEEANKQLQEMHKRLMNLENTITEQNQMLLDKDVRHENLQRITELKNLEIQQLKNKNEGLEQIVGTKDKEIQLLKENIESLCGLFQFLPSLKSLVETMENTKSLSVPFTERSDGNGREDTFIEKEVNGVSVAAMAKHFVTNPRSRNFSISEDDSDKEVNNVLEHTSNGNKEVQLEKKDKEFYL